MFQEHWTGEGRMPPQCAILSLVTEAVTWEPREFNLAIRTQWRVHSPSAELFTSPHGHLHTSTNQEHLPGATNKHQRSEAPTDPSWMHADISKTIAKLISLLLLIMINIYQDSLAVNQNGPTVALDALPFMQWVSTCFAGALGTEGTLSLTGTLLWTVEALWCPEPPLPECLRVWAIAQQLSKQRDRGSCSKAKALPKLCARDLTQNLLKPRAVQEMGWSFQTQLIQTIII